MNRGPRDSVLSIKTNPDIPLLVVNLNSNPLLMSVVLRKATERKECSFQIRFWKKINIIV